MTNNLLLRVGSVFVPQGGPVGETHDFDMIINMGQSNAQGTTENPWGQPPPTLTAGTFYEWNGSAIIEKSGTPDRDSASGYLGRYSGVGNGNGGYQSEFARQVNLVTNRKVLWVQYAPGGSGVIPGITYGGGNWTDEHLPNAITQINAAIAYCNANNLTFKLRGIVWQQGEAESSPLVTATTTIAQIYNAMVAMVDALETAFSSYYEPFPDGGGSFFNIIGNLGPTETNATVEWPSNNTGRMHTVFNIQRQLADDDSRIALLCFRGPWLGTRGLLQSDNVHSTRAGYDDMGLVAGKNFVTGNGNTAQAVPTGLTELSRTKSNIRISWTNNAATPRRVLVQIKESSDTVWTTVAGLLTTNTTCFVGIPKRGVSYDIRVGVWGDDGFFWGTPITKTITAASVPGDYFTASGVNGAYATAITNCLADIEAALGGSLDNLTQFTIFRSGYNADAGTTIYDIMRNADWTMTATGVTRNADHYATNGTNGDIYTAYNTGPLPCIPDRSFIFFHKQDLGQIAPLWRSGKDATADNGLTSLIGDSTSVSWRILVNANGTMTYLSQQNPPWSQDGGSFTTPVLVDGTLRDVFVTHDPVTGKWGLAADGAGSFVSQGAAKFCQPLNCEYGPRIGRLQTTFYQAKPSVIMLFSRHLTIAEYQDIRTAINDHIV